MFFFYYAMLPFMSNFVSGQRWISEMEPELGMGIVKEVNKQLVCIGFPASGETRNYAAKSTPLKRVHFESGDSIKDQNHKEHTVESVEEKEELGSGPTSFSSPAHGLDVCSRRRAPHAPSQPRVSS